MIKKDYRKQIADLNRENDKLRHQLNTEKEKVAFLALLTSDINIDEMFDSNQSKELEITEDKINE